MADCGEPPVFVRVITGSADSTAPPAEDWIDKAVADQGSPKAQADTGWIEISCEPKEVFRSPQGGRKIAAVLLAPRKLNEAIVVVTGAKIGKDPHMVTLRSGVGERTVVKLTDNPAPGNVFLAVRVGAEQPTTKAAERARTLKGGVANLQLLLQIHKPPRQDPPLQALTLHVEGKVEAVENNLVARIDRLQAEKIIDFLAREGFLDQAVDTALKDMPAPETTTYTMALRGPGGIELRQDLGWNLAMLRRLEALKTVLSGDAAKQMGGLLGPLSGYKRQWEASAEGGAAAVRQGVEGNVSKQKGNFMPGPGAAGGRTTPLSVPVHVFRGKLKPMEKFDRRHAQFVVTARSDDKGCYRVGLDPGVYTVVAEIDGKLHLNLMRNDGTWATVAVDRGKWTHWDIVDSSEAAF
jgi:hypothetical protein